MSENYSHWHTDMTISRDSDDDGPRWTTDPCVTGHDDDEAQARHGDDDDLFTC